MSGFSTEDITLNFYGPVIIFNIDFSEPFKAGTNFAAEFAN